MFEVDFTFLHTFSAYLGSEKPLGFLSSPFEVIPPPSPQGNAGITFRFKTEKGIFGELRISPDQNGYFHIHYVSSGIPGSWAEGKSMGYGREILRRTVAFAYTRGLHGVETSDFLSGVVTFWFGMAFRSRVPVRPAFPAGHPQTEAWKARFEQNPDTVWDIAQEKEFGRDVLRHERGGGILSFRDEVQCRRAFSRLKLDL